MAFNSKKTEGASSEERKEVDTGKMFQDSNIGAYLGGKGLAMDEEQVVMGTKLWHPFKGKACQWTSDLSVYSLEHEMHTQIITSSKNIF